MSGARDYQEIEVTSLVPFANHPFAQYEGRRLEDMVLSIRTNGVLLPIVVRPVEARKYEILSGHNRVNAATQAGLVTIPAVVRKGLTEDEAFLIVTETNLIQRSFADLRHSERSLAIATHYDAMKKKPGYRSDLLRDIETITYSPVVKKSSMGKLGELYGLSKDTIARYLRVNRLIDGLKHRLDNDEIALRVAVTLSYLRESEQGIVEGLLAEGKQLSIKQSNVLREESRKGELRGGYIRSLFEPGFFPAKVKPVKFSGKFLSEFFDATQSADEIESTVAEALRQYFA
jgi:ParB family chromosome partitioning protein